MSIIDEYADYVKSLAKIKAASAEGDRLLLTLESEAILSMDMSQIRGLAKLSATQRENVLLRGGGTLLIWPDGGASILVEWLIEKATGMQSLKSAQRKGGSSRSEAKVAAVRANGAKGGRPRKMPVDAT